MKKSIYMAEGGGEFGYDDPILDKNIDNDGDGEAVQQSLDNTQPFKPGQASTPYHGGEQHEMQTMHHEQSGLPDTSYEEVPLLSDLFSHEDKQSKIDGAIDFIKKRFPKAEFKKLGPIVFSKKGAKADIVSLGPKGGETQIFKKGNREFLKSVTDKFKKTLGPSAVQKKAEEDISIREQQQKLAEAEKQQREAKKIAVERDKELQEMENLKQQIERTQARIDAIQEEYGSNLESETELQRLKQLKKNHQTEYERKKKEVAGLEKQVKNKQEAEEKVSRERAKVDEIVKKRNLIEERLYSTKPLDDLNEREAELRQQNAEDQAIIDDTNTPSSEKEAARDRIEERIEEIARLQTQIAEREEAMPLCEKVRENFKKHGVTVTSILLAVGVTIGVVVNAVTKGLKATGKAMANGLKEISAKLSSLLPGLIGQAAHFLFNTAAKAVGFLAEHTWLIILAVVAFVFGKYIKKRR